MSVADAFSCAFLVLASWWFLYERATARERRRCIDWCRSFARDDGTAQRIEAGIRGGR